MVLLLHTVYALWSGFTSSLAITIAKIEGGDRFAFSNETSNERESVRDSRGGDNKLKWHPIERPRTEHG